MKCLRSICKTLFSIDVIVFVCKSYIQQIFGLVLNRINAMKNSFVLDQNVIIGVEL